MTYATSRDDAFSTRIEAAIEDFASQYELNAYSSVPKRTIFLFPGGLGSELMRSFQAYPGAALSFEKVWLDAGIWDDDIPHLKMLIGDIDTEQKYIVPASCVDIPGPAFLHAYEVFIQWCRRNSIDLFVFGWDWRRSVQDAADFFLNVFMPKFDARFAGMTPHPLDHFTFLGHSAGGMVIKAMLNSTANQYVQRVKKAITVATPFYGYGGQILRFLRGDSYLLVALIPRSSSAAIISSLPGGYEYPYLGYQTYLDNKAAFESDPEGYNLNAYPSVDANDPTKVADPYDYDPLPDVNGKVRYPLLYGFKSSLLSQGHVTAQSISRPFTAAEATIAAKFFNIRGVQTSNGQDVNETPVGQSWARVLPWFSADLGPDPIQFQMGPGDGTQSAWTARLLGLPANQIITIKGDDVDHANMLDLVDVRAQIAALIGLDPNTMDFDDDDVFGLEDLAATFEDFSKFIEEMTKLAEVGRDFRPEQLSWLAYRQLIARRTAYLQQFNPAQLQGLLARFYIEAVNHPGKIRVPSKDGKPPVSKGEKPAEHDRGPAGKK
jgi:pimeloyl-ACP methyl ester carboxylesterase